MTPEAAAKRAQALLEQLPKLIGDAKVAMAVWSASGLRGGSEALPESGDPYDAYRAAQSCVDLCIKGIASYLEIVGTGQLDGRPMRGRDSGGRGRKRKATR